jgi:hypothetical protein
MPSDSVCELTGRDKSRSGIAAPSAAVLVISGIAVLPATVWAEGDQFNGPPYASS